MGYPELLVSESGLGWGGQPRAHSKVPGRDSSTASRLWQRYSGDRHIERAFWETALAPRWLERPRRVPPALAFNLIFSPEMTDIVFRARRTRKVRKAETLPRSTNSVVYL